MLTIDNPTVPFFSEIRNGMPGDAEIDITGQAVPGQNHFICFELKTMDGIAFHCDIRMKNNSSDVIVLNSYHNSKWGHEERHSNSVNPSGPFHLHFECQHNDYKLLINGTSMGFRHRLSKSEINRLEIRGDLMIHRITMRNMENRIQMLSNSGTPFSMGQGFVPSGGNYQSPLGQPTYGMQPNSQLGQAYPSATAYPAGGNQALGQQGYSTGSNAPLGSQGYSPESDTSLRQNYGMQPNSQLGQNYGMQPSSQLGQPTYGMDQNSQLGQSGPKLESRYSEASPYEKTPGTDGSYRYF